MLHSTINHQGGLHIHIDINNAVQVIAKKRTLKALN